MIINNPNPIHRLEGVIPDKIYENSTKFVEFLKAYYQWLHTSTFDVSDVTGTFVSGEYVVGQTSKTKAKILQIKSGQLVVSIQGELPFIRGESILGETSNATADLDSIKDNILRTSEKLIDYRDVELSLDKFSDYLKYELYNSFPNSFEGDEVLLAKKVRDLYNSKGQEQAHKYLFKSLYDQDIEIMYPGEEILRVSDGKFSQVKIFRAVIIPNIFNFQFKTVRGATSNAIANVTDVRLIYVGSTQIAEMTLSLVSGTFLANETIYDVSDNTLSTTLYGIVSGFQINNPGTGYQEQDILTVNGDGEPAYIVVDSIYKSPIDSIKVNSIGYGYRLNTYATIDNTGTSGSGLIIKVTGIEDTYDVTSGPNTYTVGKISKVSVANRGSNYRDVPSIVLEDTTIKNLGLLTDGLFTIQNPGYDYAVNNWLSFSGGPGSGANAIVASVIEPDTTLILEDNSVILLENKSYLKNENATFIGPIRKIEMTNFGSGYSQTSLPTITVNSVLGSSANIICTGIQGTGADVQVDAANNTSGIGAIRSIKINDFGVNYTYATVDTSAAGNGDANLTPIISGIGIPKGEFINDDGKINYKKIQDSYYYQDFSYVIQSGLNINAYKDTVKRILHPAGLEFFGEFGLVRIVGSLDLSLNITTEISTIKLRNIIVELISSLSVAASTIPTILNFWGLIPVGFVASNTISEFASITFNDPYAGAVVFGYESVTRYKKISGTVNTYSNNVVIGTGTFFNTQVSNGDFLLIGNDQLKVNNISSNTLLTVTTSANTNYTNSIVYAT